MCTRSPSSFTNIKLMFFITRWNLKIMISILNSLSLKEVHMIMWLPVLGDDCKTYGTYIVNGRLGKNTSNGSFTCVGQNGCSLIDYPSALAVILLKWFIGFLSCLIEIILHKVDKKAMIRNRYMHAKDTVSESYGMCDAYLVVSTCSLKLYEISVYFVCH